VSSIPAAHYETIELELLRAWEPSDNLEPPPVGERDGVRHFISHVNKTPEK
jgi:hypothetical protein